jgi:hypothetical protein
MFSGTLHVSHMTVLGVVERRARRSERRRGRQRQQCQQRDHHRISRLRLVDGPQKSCETSPRGAGRGGNPPDEVSGDFVVQQAGARLSRSSGDDLVLLDEVARRIGVVRRSRPAPCRCSQLAAPLSAFNPRPHPGPGSGRRPCAADGPAPFIRLAAPTARHKTTKQALAIVAACAPFHELDSSEGGASAATAMSN